ncbi:MAG: winged helix-turn-helix transcriptional regulator [Deferribacteres bacterium]|nr:winged helix-turn-helix transcriptional regulator [Deferribacteres bacterium]
MGFENLPLIGIRTSQSKDKKGEKTGTSQKESSNPTLSEQRSINYLFSRSPKMRELLLAMSEFAMGSAALASVVGVRKRTLARWLALLEEKGLVARDKEGNLYLWALTPHGEALKKRLEVRR